MRGNCDNRMTTAIRRQIQAGLRRKRSHSAVGAGGLPARAMPRQSGEARMRDNRKVAVMTARCHKPAVIHEPRALETDDDPATYIKSTTSSPGADAEDTRRRTPHSPNRR